MCSFRRKTQKELAYELNLSQQEYSRLESKEKIDDDLLERISLILDFPVELIKILDGNKGNVFNYDFSSSERIVELYEKMLREKDDIIRQKDDVIEMYKKQQKAS